MPHARLESSGLDCSDGKRSDGVTMVPWKDGKPLVWDATCPDTLVPSYREVATNQVGRVASSAEEKRVTKYSKLLPTRSFTPVAIGTLGSNGVRSTSMTCLKELGYHIRQTTGEVKAIAYLLHCLQ